MSAIPRRQEQEGQQQKADDAAEDLARRTETIHSSRLGLGDVCSSASASASALGQRTGPGRNGPLWASREAAGAEPCSGADIHVAGCSFHRSAFSPVSSIAGQADVNGLATVGPRWLWPSLRT